MEFRDPQAAANIGSHQRKFILKSVHHASGAGKTGFTSPILPFLLALVFLKGFREAIGAALAEASSLWPQDCKMAGKITKMEETEMAGNRGSALLKSTEPKKSS